MCKLKQHERIREKPEPGPGGQTDSTAGGEMAEEGTVQGLMGMVGCGLSCPEGRSELKQVGRGSRS